MSWAGRSAGWALVLAGAGLVADGVLTLTWQEPLGALRQAHAQGGLERRLLDQERRWGVVAAARSTLAPVPSAGGARARLTPIPQLARAPDQEGLAAAFRRELGDGDPVGRLQIPRLGVDEVVVHGTTPALLARAPGHYARTRLPGQGGTVGIAGHRTTHGAPLREADRLRRGDRIVLRTPYGRFAYAVTGTRIVAPSDVGVLRSRGGRERLVLTTCHPLRTSSQRLVVLARRTTSV